MPIGYPSRPVKPLFGQPDAELEPGKEADPHPIHQNRYCHGAAKSYSKLADSRRAFHPWGMNYGNAGRLMEDFWDYDWETFAGDFRELKAMGANVVRVHLQFGKFMTAPNEPNRNTMRQFRRLLRLAEETGLYLDVTGLACYRPSDVPAWYDALDESARWAAQAKFWEAVAKVGSSGAAVFCYNLMNEPISPAQRREPGQWRSGHLFGGYDFLQYIALDPPGAPARRSCNSGFSG